MVVSPALKSIAQRYHTAASVTLPLHVSTVISATRPIVTGQPAPKYPALIVNAIFAPQPVLIPAIIVW